MENYKIKELFIYPIKSLGGISVKEAETTDRGFKYDRRWMVVNFNGDFLTQRSIPQMALITVDIYNDSLVLRYKKSSEQFEVKMNETTGKNLLAKVWDDAVETLHVSYSVDEWLSMVLQIKCKLVYMPQKSIRYVDEKYTENKEVTSLSDGYPFLLIGQSSLDDLNSRLTQNIPMNRFRPNIVFSGGIAFDEDKWNSFNIGEVVFYPVKQCSRCVVITTDQETGERNNEPLATLSSYRKINNKVMFGQNVIHKGKGIVKVGDELTNIQWK